MTDFEMWWPVAEARLQVMLRGMRVHRDSIEEITQETAARACGKTFENERHLVAWSVVVARRIVFNETRRKARRAAATLQLTIPVQDSVEDVVTALLKRDSLLEVIQQLPESRRVVLASTTSDDRREAGRLAVARHRARTELRRVYDRLGVAIATWRLRAASGLGFGSESVGEAGNATAAVLSAALALLGAAAVIASTLLPHAARDPHHPEAVARAKAEVAQRAVRSQPAAPDAVDVARTGGPPETTRPDLRLSLGTDSAGRDRKAEVRSPEPQEEGALVCVGAPEDPDYRCAKWPAVVLGLGSLLHP